MPADRGPTTTASSRQCCLRARPTAYAAARQDVREPSTPTRMSVGPSDPSSNSGSGEATRPVCQAGPRQSPPGQTPVDQSAMPRRPATLRRAVPRFNALLAQQPAQPPDLVRQPVQFVLQRRKVQVRGGPLVLPGGLVGQQLPFPVAEHRGV